MRQYPKYDRSIPKMGDEIERTEFTQEDFDRFERSVEEETELLRTWFDDQVFDSKSQCFGIELEGWLVNKDFLPSPCNQEFLNQPHESSIVHELSKFNFEINSRCHTLNSNLLSQIQADLSLSWNESLRMCSQIGTDSDFGPIHPMMIGILPTLRDPMLTLDSMSPLNRYFALSQQILKYREGQPIRIEIEGKDRMEVEHSDILIEAAATSIQIHTQVGIQDAVRTYNFAHVLSAMSVAASSNSPFFFGQELWEETRIPIFEQAVSIANFSGPRGRYPHSVTFGDSYARRSLMEPFDENKLDYPVLLPIQFDSPTEELKHLKLQNGTVWRWSRPIVGFNADGTPHLRIEHRVMPSGPTIVDMVANSALYIGALHAFVKGSADEIPFNLAKDNFYSASKLGLSAPILGFGNHRSIQHFIFDELIGLAKSGLKDLGLDSEEIRYYLDEIMHNRIKNGQTGSQWQRAFVETHGKDFQALSQAYYENQSLGQPVHEWKV